MNHPQDLAFYRSRIETLQNINHGIGGCASVLRNMQVMKESGNQPDWYSGYTSACLLSAINALTNHAAHSVEFMIDCILEHESGDSQPDSQEITFAVSTEEAALIDQFAEKWDCTRDVAATQLAKEALHRMTDELTYPRKN